MTKNIELKSKDKSWPRGKSR